MTLKNYIELLQTWLETNEYSFVSKLTNYTNSFNKLTSLDSNFSPQPSEEILKEWLQDKDNFTYATSLLMLKYSKIISEDIAQYYTIESKNKDFEVSLDLFNSWNKSSYKTLCILNAYATFFAFSLQKNYPQGYKFSQGDLDETINILEDYE